MIVDAQQEQIKRQLRRRIGRLRRRIDNRIRGSSREARRLTSWRTYVKHYPASAIMAALGVGLALSAGLSARRLSRWLGLRLLRQGWDTASGLLRQEIEQLWADSSPHTRRCQERFSVHCAKKVPDTFDPGGAEHGPG